MLANENVAQSKHYQKIMDYHVFRKNWSIKELQDSFKSNDLVFLYSETDFGESGFSNFSASASVIVGDFSTTSPMCTKVVLK